MSRGPRKTVMVLPKSLQELPEICQPKQVASALGISVGSVYQEIAEGHLPAAHIGRGKIRPLLLIRRENVFAWIKKKETDWR